MVAAIPVPPRLKEDIQTSDARNLRLFLQNVKERVDHVVTTNTTLTDQVTVLRQQAASTVIPAASVFTQFFETPEQAATFNTNGDIAHGFGKTPTLVRAFLRCKITELNWAVGDELPFETVAQATNNDGLTVAGNVLNVRYSIGSGMIIEDRLTHLVSTITAVNWRVVIRAWA